MHPMAPWTDVTFAGVYWNEAKRLPALLARVRPWFHSIVVGVQESDDDTLAIAGSVADAVVEDQHHGHAEPTFNLVLERIRTPWAFVVSGDEMPSDDLLDSFQSMVEVAAQFGNNEVDAFAIRFRSTIEGIDFSGEHDQHTRVFRSHLRWPTTMHSEPRDVRRTLTWDTGHILHDRSLTEMVTDYLRYYRIGRGNEGWDAHNTMMLRSCCEGVARNLGWAYVKAFDWWGEALKVGFKGRDPEA